MSTNRRLILVNHLLEPPGRITGITKFLFGLLSELIQRPHFRYALATTWKDDDLPSALRHPNLAVITCAYHQSTPRNLAAQTTLVASLIRKFDAVLEFNANPLGCFRPGWPRVVTVHDLYFDVLGSHYPLRHRLWWKLFFPLVLAASQAVICVSRSTRNDLARFHHRGAKKATVIHSASALLGRSTPDRTIIGSETPYAIYVGNISPNKNPALLVAALKCLENRGSPTKVYHAGRDDADILARALAGTVLQTPVQGVRGLSDAELGAAYRAATCLIVTSTYEGFCLPVIEAQVLGVPVICSDIPVLREVAGEGALFFDPRSPEQLADRIELVFGDYGLRQRLAQIGHENAARFSWNRAAAEAEDLFDRIIAKSGGRSKQINRKSSPAA